MSSRYEVSTVFKAINLVSEPVRRMARDVGTSTLQMERGIRSVTRATNEMASSFGRAARAASAFAIGGLASLGGALLFVTKAFSQIENAEASFTPLLGGIANAKKAVADLNELAVVTPFVFDDLASASRVLLSMKAATQDSLIPTLRMLGDVSGGNADRLGRIALVYSQVVSAGKANSRDMMQFIDAGVPISALLAEKLGKNITQIRDMTEAGRISGDMVVEVLKQATQFGGMFYNMMQLQSLTTEGLFATLMGNIMMAAAKIGEAISPVVKEIIVDMTIFAQEVRAWANNADNIKPIAENFRKIVDHIKVLLNFIKNNWREILKFTGALLAAYAALVSLQGVITAINLIKMADTWEIVIWVIYAAVVAIMALWAWWDTFSKANPVLANTLLWVGIVIAGVTVSIIALTASFVILKYTMLGLAAVFIFLMSSPIGLFIAGIGILAATLYLLYTNFESVRNIMSEIGNFISNVATKAWIIFGDVVGFIVDSIAEKINGLIEAVSDFISLKNTLFSFGSAPGFLSVPNPGADFSQNSAARGRSPDSPIYGMQDSAELVSSPQERFSEIITRQLTETNSSIGITVKDDTGRAQVTKTGTPLANFKMFQSGAFVESM